MYQTILWDFNGTILNDVAIGIDSINTLLRRRNLPLIEGEERYRERFRFPIIDYYTELGFDKTEYDILAIEWIEQYLSRVPLAPVQDGIIDVLDALKTAGKRQIILSASETAQLRKQVSELGIAPYFSDILGLDNIHAKSKVEMAIEWKKRTDAGKMILIGDTDHDAATAKAIGADCVLLAAGHQSLKRLENCGVRVVQHPSELISLILGSEDM